MISLLLTAAICTSPPMFAMDGPPCADETVSCRCSECFAWDASDRATRYEIVRETMSTHAVYATGTVLSRFVDDEGTLELATTWCAADDVPFPRAGVLYRYQVRACNATGCAGLSNAVLYRGAPYACFADGREVACYVGDVVVTR